MVFKSNQAPVSKPRAGVDRARRSQPARISADNNFLPPGSYMHSLRKQRLSPLSGVRRQSIHPALVESACRRQQPSHKAKLHMQLCNLRRAPAPFHPHADGLRKAANKGARTASWRIIPTIDFCCWVLQMETVGLSGQDPSALSLTKRVFSGLIRQKAYY